MATRTSGSERRAEETTGRDTGTAPRPDPNHFNVRLEESRLCTLFIVAVMVE